MSRRSRGRWLSAISSLARGNAKRSAAVRPETRRLRLESLEDRRLLAFFYVTNSNDDLNPGSLRWAITQANASPGPDTIDTIENFGIPGQQTTPHDINLTLNGTALPTITDDLTIIGHLGSGLVVGRLEVSGNDLSRVFRVDYDVTVSLINAVVKQGLTQKTVGGDFYDGYGGAILNFGALNIVNSTITDSRASNFGGGIANFGAMAISNSTISANEAPDGGGMVNGGTLPVTITNSTFANNLAASSAGPALGGGLSNRTGNGVTTTLDRVTFQGNAAVGNNGVGGGNGVAGYGGGVYVARGIVTIVDCTIASNTAQGGVGSVGVVGTNAPATPTLPYGSWGAQGGAGGTGGVGGAGLGGGLYVQAGEVTSLRTTISGNVARGGAGGAGGKGGEGGVGGDGHDVRTDTFGGITQLATSGGRGGDGGPGGVGGGGGTGGGGGVYQLNGSLDLRNSTIANNQAAGGVGGVGGQGSGGRAGGNGGSGSQSANLSTNGANGGAGGNGGQGGSGGASGAASGGGLGYATGSLRLVNATIADNQANGGAVPAVATGGAAGLGGAGGIGVGGGGLNGARGGAGAVGGAGAAGALGSSSAGGLAAGSGVYLANSIVARNNAGSAASDVAGSLDTLSRRNLVGVGGAGGLTIGVNGNLIGIADPRLGTLANNGGLTQTIAIFHDSPALNAGENASALNSGGQPLSTDQRGAGFLRIVGASVDIGAFESPYGAESLVVTTLADEDNGYSNPSLGAGTSLREAINWANLHGGADTILFHPLLDVGVITLGGTQLPAISGALAIYGPGPVSLSISGNNASRVFEVAAGADVTLSGLSIVDGYASRGGGIYNLGTLEVYVCVLSDNVAFGTTLVTDIFSSATSDGGGAIFNAGALSVVESTLAGNSAALFGGGLANAGATTTTDSIIADNTAVAGGGIYNNHTLNFRNSTLANNSATGTNTTFGFGGGGGLRNDATATLVNSTLANNWATRNGGGIFNFDETVTLLHSTLSGNRADADGNNANDTGGGVFTSPNVFTATQMRNTIVAGNLRGPLGGTTANDLGGRIAELSSAYNLIGAAGSAAGLVDGQNGNIVGVDPKLGPLVDDGWSTRTFAPLAGSPAINAGDPAFDPQTFSPPLTNDQRVGFARVLGGRVDIGAVEVPSGDFNGDGQVDGADFLKWQREFGYAATPIGKGADGNGSGAVDSADLAVWRQSFGTPSAATAVFAAQAIVAPTTVEPLDKAMASMDEATENEVPFSALASPLDGEAAVDSALISIAQAASGFQRSTWSEAAGRRTQSVNKSAAEAGFEGHHKDRHVPESAARNAQRGWEAFFSELGEDGDHEDFERISTNLLDAI